MVELTATSREAFLEEAVTILQELRRHTRLTDKDAMKFTAEYPEGLFDRLDRFLRKVGKPTQSGQRRG